MPIPVMPPVGNADERLVAALKTLGTGALTGIPETANLLASMRDRNTQIDILRRYHDRSQTGQSAAGALGSAVGSRMEEMPGQQLYNAMWDQRRQEMDAAGIPFAGQLGLEIGSPDLTDLGHLAAVLPARLAKKGSRAAEGALAQVEDSGIGGFRSIGGSPNSKHLRDSSDQIPSKEQLVAGLAGDKKKALVHANRRLEPDDTRLRPGGLARLRIDIPFFTGNGQYAVTVHGVGKGVGRVLGYDSIVRLDGPVEFSSNEKVASRILRGEATKTPIATVDGRLTQNREIPEDIDAWTAVGYDPHKATHFYDKVTGQEVLSGTDAISVGNTVYIREPKYGGRRAGSLTSRAAEGATPGDTLATSLPIKGKK